MKRSARTAAGLSGAVAALVAVALTTSTFTSAGSADAAARRYGIGSALYLARDGGDRALPGTAAKPAPARPAAPVRPAAPAAPATEPAVSEEPAGTPVPEPTAEATSAPDTAVRPPFVATLVTNGDNAAQESQAGLKMGMLEFQWRYLEPQRGVYNEKYAASMSILFNKLRKAGMRVTLGLGLHFAPQWALDLANSRMVNQNGQSSATVDLVFNSELRSLAAGYLAMIDRAVGLANFWGIRITSGGVSELLYPTTSYWAYSNGAQNGALKPASMRPNPMPGWKPADPATAAQRESFGRWYVDALADVADWQMQTLAGLGFDGYYQLLTPGQGFRPTQLPMVFKSKLVDGLPSRRRSR